MNGLDASLAVLRKSESTLTEVMQALAFLDTLEFPASRTIGVSSSVTLERLGLALRRQAYLAGVRLDVRMGNYDDPVGDVGRFVDAGVEQMILWPFFDTLQPSFEAQLGTLNPEAVEAREAELRERYRLALERARPMSAVFLGTFHRLGLGSDPSGGDAVAATVARFNQALRSEAQAFSNVRMIDAEGLLRAVGQSAAFDLRFYFSAKAPYGGPFLNELARRVSLGSRGFGTHFFKALVLDCDNTLWGGVVGEDLITGIRLGQHDAPGSIFWRAQHELAALERAGVLLCLCSKNNPADVDEVLHKHPEMVLRDQHLVLKKVNWDDKPSNLRAIAKELNVGLDSLVFLDDSSFECEAVRQQLPMVKTFQVPATLSEYPRVLREIAELFVAGGITAESRGKTEQYRQRSSAEQARAQFEDQDAYLASLELKVELAKNARASIARISELSMKSNQFNLTTRRYSEAEIERFMNDPGRAVYSLTVRDKFGPAGLTGVVVMSFDGAVATVDNFLMSCRVIGRGVELSIWSRIVADAMSRGCTELRAEFVPTAKNAQVNDFFDRLGLPLDQATAQGGRQYRVTTTAFAPPPSSWIEVTYVE